MQDIKTLFSFKGKVLGEAFEVDGGYAFQHYGEDVTVGGFDSLEAAWDALWCFHEEWHENL